MIDPGSEWRLHRQWFERSAMGDLLGEDFDLVQKDNLYRCLDKLLAHKTELFSFLQQRWKMSIGTQTGPLSASKRGTWLQPAQVGSLQREGFARLIGWDRRLLQAKELALWFAAGRTGIHVDVLTRQ